jgi:hypothetical protein
MADPAVVQRILHAADFTDITFTEVDEPVFYGRDVPAALEWVRGFASTKEVLAGLDPLSRELALERLRGTLAAHAREAGIWFDSRAWIVNASRP